MATKKGKKVTITAKKGKSGGKKAKQAKPKTVFDLPEDLAERARDIWLAGLGALSTVEAEGAKLFSSLVEKGETWEREGRKTLGAARQTVETAKDKVETTVGEVAAKGGELDDKVFGAVEEAVESVLQRLGVPTRAEVKDLTDKVEDLSDKVSALATVIGKNKSRSKNGSARSAAVRPARKSVFHVVPHGEDWAVKKEKVKTPAGIHGTKSEALDAARGLAKAHTPSRLVVHKQDGTVQQSMTYDA